MYFIKCISVSLKRLVNKREIILFLGNHRKIFKMAVTWAWIIFSLSLVICGFPIAGMVPLYQGLFKIGEKRKTKLV
jgi:hypothetical protein